MGGRKKISSASTARFPFWVDMILSLSNRISPDVSLRRLLVLGLGMLVEVVVAVAAVAFADMAKVVVCESE